MEDEAFKAQGKPSHFRAAAMATCALAGAAAYSVFGTADRISFSAELLVLLGLALASELLPVELWRGGLRLTFTVPFIAAIALTSGPLAAISADVGATLVAAILSARRAVRCDSTWLLLNIAISLLSAFFGCVLVGAVLDGSPIWVQAAAFVCAYAMTNSALVAFLEAARGRSLARSTIEAFSLCAKPLPIYALLAVSLGALAQDRLVLLAPLTLVPILALRMALSYHARMNDNYYDKVAALTLMLQRAHPYTHAHLERVAVAAEDVARSLGLGRLRARQVREAALLHDIGKIAINEEVLDKPARLTPDEMRHVRMHAAWGAEIIRPVRGLAELAPWIRHHHERPDGTGYPDGLTDPEIPIESKIIAVVDAFDAMTGFDHPSGKRPYRENMSVTAALDELERCSGSQFDAAVVRAFKAALQQGVPC